MATHDSTCSIRDCARPAKARGMCSKHYQNLRKYGHAIARRDWSIEDVLDDIGWDYTEDGCWEWRGDRNELGYGRLTLKRKGLDKTRVHRLMFERYVGSIPDGMVIRHKCDNPPCCNPDHLEVGTQADNLADMVSRGRYHRHGSTECQNGHDISSPGSYRMGKRKNKGDEKVCLACQRERHLRHREKKNLERAKLRDYSEAA